MAKPKAYGGAVLIGGGEGALDRPELDGDILNDLDLAFVNTAGILSPYWLDDDSGAAESSPDVIAPDTNPGTKRWILQGINCASLITSGNLTIGGQILAGDGLGNAPSLSFANAPTRGFWLKDPGAGDTIGISIGAERFQINAVGGGQIRSAGNAGAILNEAPSDTNPTVVPAVDNPITGVGSAGTNILSLIAGALEGIRIEENTSAIRLGFYPGTTPVAQQTGVAVSAAAIHAALISLGLFTA